MSQSALKDGRGILAAAVLASFIVVFDQSTVNLVVPTLADAFHTPVSTVQLIVSAQLLALALVIPLSTILRDRYGDRRAYVFGLSTIILGDLFSGLAPNLTVLVASRILHGFGSGLLLPTTLGMVIRAFPPERRGTAIGNWVSGATVALVAGPALGGILADSLGWSSVFLVSVPMASFSLLLGQARIPRGMGMAGVRQPFDWRGFGWIAAALLGGVLWLETPEQMAGLPLGWLRHGGFVAVLVSAIGLTRHIARAEAPLFPRALFGDRIYVTTLFITLLRSLLLYAGVFFLPLLMQEHLGHSAGRAGVLLLPPAVAVVVATPIIGRLSDRISPLLLIAVGFLMLAVAHVVLMIPHVTSTPVWLVTMMVVRAVGLCLTVSPAVKVAFSSLPPPLENAASACLNLTQRVAGGVAVALTAKLVYWRSIGHHATADGFHAALLTMAALSVPGIVAVAALSATMRTPAKSHAGPGTVAPAAPL